MSTKQLIQKHPSCMLLRSYFKKYKRPVIIGIAGDSGSGKTTYSNGIRRILGEDIIKTIHLDGYHTEDRKTRAKTGHLPLNPKYNKLDLFKEHLKQLKLGREVKIPIYNHSNGKFGKPVSFTPSPIIIIEGLHTLYPKFLPLLDFTVYVDPAREIKWQWKYKRDIKSRGHSQSKLKKEMLKREAAYKRWIDFQKTNADIVIKIGRSRIKDMARYEALEEPPVGCFKVELIVGASKISLPDLSLPLKLSSFFDTRCAPFLVAVVPSLYWGEKTSVVHIDGVVPPTIVEALDEYLSLCTGVDIKKVLAPHEEVTATQFTQLLVAWRFLQGLSEDFSQERVARRGM